MLLAHGAATLELRLALTTCQEPWNRQLNVCAAGSFHLPSAAAWHVQAASNLALCAWAWATLMQHSVCIPACTTRR